MIKKFMVINKKMSPSPTYIKNFVYISLSFVFIQLFTGCAALRCSSELALAFFEKPSMEIVLDRLNTAACASMTAKAVLNDIPISKDSKWPEEMESFPKDQLADIVRVLALDRAYSDNGGLVSPIKAHIVQVQAILYDVPPDMYAKAGNCYDIGEQTVINNYYYKIGRNGRFIKKATYLGHERDAALSNALKQFLDFGPPKCSHRTFYKRKGKYKSSLVNKVAIKNGYRNVTEAIISVVENYNARNAEDLKMSLREIQSIKDEITNLNNEIMSLENKKTLLNNKEKIPGYANVAMVESALSLKTKDLNEKKERAIELQLIVDKSFENIQNNLPIVSKDDLIMFEKISTACKAINGLLWDSLCLTLAATWKAPASIGGIKDEFKRMNAQKSTNPFIPLRVARLKANAGNVVGNIKTIVYVLRNERRMVSWIKSTADDIIDITRSSMEKKESARVAPNKKAVKESIVLADAEISQPKL
jgi:hypothetical protein